MKTPCNSQISFQGEEVKCQWEKDHQGCHSGYLHNGKLKWSEPQHSLAVEALQRIADGDVGQGGYDPVYSKFAKDALSTLKAREVK